jgi:hypothetical protein
MNYWKPYGNIREEKGNGERACITFFSKKNYCIQIMKIDLNMT